MQSFAGKVKNELCRVPVQRLCCARAEAYGVLLYGNTFSPTEVRLITESADFAARLPRLFQRAFGLKFDRLPEEERGKLIFGITDRSKLDRIINQLGYDPRQNLVLHVNFGLLEDECCRTAFLRGAFLAGGSVTDPEKRYHLELVTSHQKVSDETYQLLLEMGFSPLDAQRGGSRILYFKRSDTIVDFLTALGAPVCAMKIIEAKMEKELRNDVNRRCNCDTANLGKAVNAAQQQIAAIRQLRKSGKLDELPEKLKSAAILREENPEATLSELAAMADPPLSKPAMSHRMRKLIELSTEG